MTPTLARATTSPVNRRGTSVIRGPNTAKKKWKISVSSILILFFVVGVCVQGLALFSYHQSYTQNNGKDDSNYAVGSNGRVSAMQGESSQSAQSSVLGHLNRNKNQPIDAPATYTSEIQLTKVELPEAIIQAKIDEIKSIYGATAVKSCRKTDCTASGLKIVAYNTMKKDRYLCGKLIKSESTNYLHDGYCHEPSHVFQKEPQIPPQEGSLPIEPISITQGSTKSGAAKPYSCNVPCQYYGGVGIKNNLFISDTEWSFIYSMEGSGYYHDLKIKPQDYKKKHFFATTSFKSEIPLPYYSRAEYNILTPAVDYDKVISGASFMAGNCASNNRREEVVRQLRSIMRVDSIGNCLHNAEPPNGVPKSNKQKVQQQYLFHLAFENTNEDDYITEKLWGTLSSGTLAVYMGAPNVKEHAPPNSIISWHDFHNTQELGQYLLQVASNKTLYDSYHEWRNHPLPESFHAKYDFTNTHSVCRMCRWAYAKNTGFGWDHKTQTVQETELPRKVCVGKDGLIGYPYIEVLGGKVANSLSSDCSPIVESQSITVAGWTRRLDFRDAIIDIMITGSGKEGEAYRIAMHDEFVAEQRGLNQYRLRDDTTRIDILSNWQHSLRSAKPWIVDVILVSRDENKIRFIVQDIDKFHIGARDVEYAFGTTMIEDFTQPLELFSVEGGKFPMT